MNESLSILILTFSVFAAGFSFFAFFYAYENCSKTQSKLMSITKELADTKNKLSAERSKRIQAESDAAYFERLIYSDNPQDYFKKF